MTQLTKQMRQWQQDLDDRIKDHKRPPKYWDFPELEKGNVHKHCAYCLRGDCARVYDSADPPEDRACSVVHCRWGCGARMHQCKLFEHKIICPLYEEEDEFAWMRKGLKREAQRIASKKAAALSTSSKLEDCGNASSDKPSTETSRRAAKATIPVPPPMPKTVQVP